MLALREQFRASPLAYPGRLAGFDPSHPAAGPVPRFSAIANGANFYNLIKSASGATVGSPTYVIDGGIGPAVQLLAASSQRASFAGQSIVQDTLITIAAIAVVLSASADKTSFLITTSTTGHGYSLGPNATNQLVFYTPNTGGGAVGPTLSLNVPYFCAVSFDGSHVKFLAANLQNGQIQTSATTYTADNAAPNGTYLIGRSASDAVQINAKIAAVMFSAQFMTPQQLLAWAADPWAFWYPRTGYGAIDIATVTGGAGFTAKFRRSLSAIGGRVGTRQAA